MTACVLSECLFFQSLVVDNMYKETFVISLLYEHLFSAASQDGGGVDTKVRIVRVLQTPLLCRRPFSLDRKSAAFLSARSGRRPRAARFCHLNSTASRSGCYNCTSCRLNIMLRVKLLRTGRQIVDASVCLAILESFDNECYLSSRRDGR